MSKGFWETLSKPFFALAPLANVTDAAFRRVIAKYSKYGGQDIFDKEGRFTSHPTMGEGPDVMWTEFVSADGLFKGGYDALIHDLRYTEAERPIVAQFFSREPELMERAAALAVERGFDGVDINMGCPDKNVCKQGAGAAMIREPDRAIAVIRAVQKGAAGKIPVSVKTRIGYNAIETDTWVPQLLETGISALTLHARTKREMSKVPAHWDEVARAVAIRDELGSNTLIIGNGDVGNIDDARAKAAVSGADGVMLGRGVFGNPWLFSGNPRPSLKERLRVLAEHITLFDELLGQVPGRPGKSFAVMKKHFKSYIQGPDGDTELIRALMETRTAAEALDYLKSQG